MPNTSTYKVLWNDEYLKSFAKTLALPACEYVFWEIDTSDELVDFKKHNIRKMVTKFFPALGVWNLVLGDDANGVPTQTLVFLRDNRCEQIDKNILRVITNKVFSYLGSLGDDIKAQFHSGTNPFSDDFISIIPDMYDKQPIADTCNSAYRFFQNGWVEIASEGVSDLRPYTMLETDDFIWNSSVIARDYQVLETKELMDKHFQSISVDGVHPVTGEYLSSEDRKVLHKEYQQKIDDFHQDASPTHFKDFVENLARDEDGDIDAEALERLELAIGYLCHRHHKPHERKFVLLVDKFSDGLSNKSNGGSGKSLLVKSLGKLMNLTELDGRSFKKGKDDMAAFAPVTPATEICHIDDAAKGFPAECLFTRVTGNFHIRRLYQSPFSIEASKAPKIVCTSNFPFEGDGNSYRRREFIVEVSNFYRLRSEFAQQTPFHIHGNKQIAEDGGGWDARDWSEYYKYVFGCISKYISKGLPASGGESDAYKRAKLVEMVGSSDLLDYLLVRLDEYAEHGQEVFVERFYKDVLTAFPEETQYIPKSNLFHYLVAAGNLSGKYPNQFKGGNLEKQRLTEERWNRWVAEGMLDWKDKNGNIKCREDRVQVFKVTSLGNISTMFSNSKPDFKKTPSPTPPPHDKTRGDAPSGLSAFLQDD